MLYGLLVTAFVLLCILLIVIILLQKSKSSMGLGGFGGGTQMLFGGSGGQDLFQKVTWVMVALFMLGSLTLTLMKSSGRHSLSSAHTQSMPSAPAPSPYASLVDEAPASTDVYAQNLPSEQAEQSESQTA
jgi:preprotein translocase subunit SecG